MMLLYVEDAVLQLEMWLLWLLLLLLMHPTQAPQLAAAG